MFLEIFSQHEHVLETLLEKLKSTFHCLYSRTYFCCHYGSVKVNSFAKLPKLSVQSTLNFCRIFSQYGHSDYYKKTVR